MCLLVLAWHSHPRYRLVIAANRDEYHARPAAALGPWNDAAGIVAGRDLTAGGAWFGIDAQRRVGIVTNFREFGRRRRSAPSRGGLIPAYLAGDATPGEYLQALETDAPGYAGFNLLLADRDALWYASNRAEQFARELSPGIYGLSNEFLDTPWPKLVRVRRRFERRSPIPDSASAGRWRPNCLPCSRTARPCPRSRCLPPNCPRSGHASCRRHSCSIRVMARAVRQS
jgi:uncharacterized protein with NRDE domain